MLRAAKTAGVSSSSSGVYFLSHARGILSPSSLTLRGRGWCCNLSLLKLVAGFVPQTPPMLPTMAHPSDAQFASVESEPSVSATTGVDDTRADADALSDDDGLCMADVLAELRECCLRSCTSIHSLTLLCVANAAQRVDHVSSRSRCRRRCVLRGAGRSRQAQRDMALAHARETSCLQARLRCLEDTFARSREHWDALDISSDTAVSPSTLGPGSRGAQSSKGALSPRDSFSPVAFSVPPVTPPRRTMQQLCDEDGASHLTWMSFASLYGKVSDVVHAIAVTLDPVADFRKPHSVVSL